MSVLDKYKMIKKGFLFYNSKLSLSEYVKEKICFDKKNQTVNVVAHTNYFKDMIFLRVNYNLL